METTIHPLLLLLIPLSIFLLYKTYISRKNPLPTSWPLFGMFPGAFLNCFRIHEYVTDVLQGCGGTFLYKGPWFTDQDLMITSDPLNIHYILSKKFHNFSKGPDYKKILDILGEGIFTSEFEKWESQRKTAMALIRNAGYDKFVATVSWKKVEECLIPTLDNVSEKGEEIDLQALINHFTFQSASILVLGHDDTISTSGDDYLIRLPDEKVFAEAEEAVLQRYLLPQFFWKIQKWLQIGKEKELSEAKESIDNYINDCISLKRRNWKKEELNEDSFDLLTAYMRIFMEKGDDDNLLKDIMFNLMFAAKDTFSATLTWFFWLLATHPEEQKKIRQEILANSSSEGGKWEFSNTEEMKKFLFLHGSLCETLRLYPAVPLQHKTPVKADRLPSGHLIKADTKTLLAFYSTGRMESIWGKDCLLFKPERWISESGGIKTEPSYKFVAFGAGPRMCLGKDMSWIQMKIVAAAIISRYEIQVADGHVISPRNSIILDMKHGLKVKVSKCV